jgi:hypothetical protein
MKDFDLDNDVVDFSVNGGLPEFMKESPTVLVNSLISHIADSLGRNSNGVRELFDDGISCRVMKTTSPKWQEGRLKLTLEFVPEEEQPSESN